MGNPNHDKLGRFTTGHGGAASLAAGLGSVHQSHVGGLNVTASAPSKDKPVILVYGGAFNPPHEGHSDGALRPAQEALTAAGYKVDGAIVVPTADKLLSKKKMGLTNRLGLEARGRISEVSFPKDINGTPVSVRIEPSQEVEKASGKPRRTDLANWAQKQYPNHTIINVTGEDASVPGAPGQHPSLYSGEIGSNHSGYNYLTLPRPEGGLSSTMIRQAANNGTKIPGMSAEAERAYRDELKVHQAKISEAFNFGHNPHESDSKAERERLEDERVAKARKEYFDKQAAKKAMKGRGVRYASGKLKNTPAASAGAMRDLLGDGRFK